MTTQLTLSFYQPLTTKEKKSNSEWGTFKDSLRAPVHRWFTYPAGFSYKAVEHSLRRFGIATGQTVYDPFMGSGTTNITAKTMGINSIGTEAHPFVFRIARTKLNWEMDQEKIFEFVQFVEEKLSQKSLALKKRRLESEFPELILKCYEEKTLYDLWALKELIFKHLDDNNLKDFFFVVTTALLRDVSTAATGWPYIAPNKRKITSIDKDVLVEFSILARQMAADLQKIKLISRNRYEETRHDIFNGDSRDTKAFIKDESADHVFTSPPYLNNFDYADRTRLELYFWGEAKSWGDISETIRTQLMTSATTQINRSDTRYKILDAFKQECPTVSKFVSESAEKLSVLRKTKGGKKSYDLMVAGYFNDIYQIIKDTYRILKPNAYALFVLGDSAPYGIHIPTDILIGDIGVNIGFKSYDIEVLRTRGDKWKENPQRHNIPLRESVVILKK